LLLQQRPSREDDIELMNNELKKRNFSVEIIRPEEATKENLTDKIGKLAEKSSNYSKTIFYFAGHGSIDSGIQGICLNKDSTCINEGDEFVLFSPLEFYEEISNIKGEKAVIIDTCFSGAFTEYLKSDSNSENIYKEYKSSVKNLENYLAIAACPELTTSVISTEYLDGRNISALMNGLYPLLSSEKEEINMSKENFKCGNEKDRANIDATNETLLLSGREYLLSYEMQRVFDINFILPERFDKVDESFLYKSL